MIFTNKELCKGNVIAIDDKTIIVEYGNRVDVFEFASDKFKDYKYGDEIDLIKYSFLGLYYRVYLLAECKGVVEK